MTAPTEGGPPAEGAAATGELATCYRHPDRETGVRCARCDRPICPQCMIPASVGFQCPECVNEGRRSMRPVRTVYGGRVNRGGIDVTRVLIGINVAVFLITLSGGGNVLTGTGNTSSLYDKFALLPVAVAKGEWWRLFSSMFLHYGIPHIVFNMWALFIIGPSLERVLGRLRYVALYFLAGVGGGILSFATGDLFTPAAGASGAIFGLFGAFYVVTRRRGLDTGPIVGLIAINLVISFSFSNISWRGHVGGLVVGLAVAFVLAWAPAGPNRGRVQAAGCVIVALILAASGYAGAAHVHRQCPSYRAVPVPGGTAISCSG